MMNKQEFLTSAGLEMQTLDLWLEQRWLIPDQTFGEINFRDVDLARARLILDLKTGLKSTTRASTSSFISWTSSTACVAHSTNCARISRNFAPGLQPSWRVCNDREAAPLITAQRTGDDGWAMAMASTDARSKARDPILRAAKAEEFATATSPLATTLRRSLQLSRPLADRLINSA